jgi:hypothetical protein
MMFFTRLKLAPGRSIDVSIKAGALLVAALCACDGSEGPRDASSAPARTEVREVAVRIDAPAGGPPAASVLAYRARIEGADAELDLRDHILGAVDPLITAAPAQRCTTRRVDETATLLRARTDSVELEALADVSLSLGLAGDPLRPAPRVYPDLASVVAGVVAEAGPVDLAEMPPALALLTDRGPVATELPALPSLLLADGTPLASGTTLPSDRDLWLHINAPAGSFVELRPFGAPEWLACPIVAGRALVPADALSLVARQAARVPVSLDVVWRSRRPVSLGGQPARLSLETRFSALVGLGL